MFKIDKGYIYSSASIFFKIYGIYALWLLVHYVSAHLYIYLCVPATIIGFILSPFLVPSPHCHALRWAIYNGGNSIIAMWTILGVWCMSILKIINYNP